MSRGRLLSPYFFLRSITRVRSALYLTSPYLFGESACDSATGDDGSISKATPAFLQFGYEGYVELFCDNFMNGTSEPKDLDAGWDCIVYCAAGFLICMKSAAAMPKPLPKS